MIRKADMEKPTVDQCLFFYQILTSGFNARWPNSFSPSDFPGSLLGYAPVYLLEETTTMNQKRLVTLKRRYYTRILPNKWLSWIENAYYFGDIVLKDLPYSSQFLLTYLNIKVRARNSGLVSTRIRNNALSVEWKMFLKETLTEDDWNGITWVG